MEMHKNSNPSVLLHVHGVISLHHSSVGIYDAKQQQMCQTKQARKTGPKPN